MRVGRAMRRIWIRERLTGMEIEDGFGKGMDQALANFQRMRSHSDGCSARMWTLTPASFLLRNRMELWSTIARESSKWEMPCMLRRGNCRNGERGSMLPITRLPSSSIWMSCCSEACSKSRGMSSASTDSGRLRYLW